MAVLQFANPGSSRLQAQTGVGAEPPDRTSAYVSIESNREPAPSSLTEAAGRYRRWLFASALPLWATVGADEQGWGYEERIDAEGRPVREPRRLRVQARQTYAFATAGALGWDGPWRAAVSRGLAGLMTRYRRDDGLFRTLVSGGGEPLDDTAKLYDQAFVLLAMACAAPLHPTAADARALLETVESRMRHPAGGYREHGDQPFQSVPHLHLLEAALGWLEAGSGGAWEGLAAEMVDLALDRLMDPDSGVIRGAYQQDWSPCPDDGGGPIEPGQQFEWAWLLLRWARLTGDSRAIAAARRLFAAGRGGVDPARNVTVDALNGDLSLRSSGARLWPQAERLKAALILGEEAEALAAARSLWRYLDTGTPGVWRDRMTAEGAFVDEPAPATSLYHIAAAVDQLTRSAS